MDEPIEVSQILQQQSINLKCSQLTNMIRNYLSNNQINDLVSKFKPIVENIFGIVDSPSLTSINPYNSSPTSRMMRQNCPSGPSWMIHSISASSNLSDYNAIYSFLFPDGVLFSMIKALMMDTNAKFEFPISVFPIYLRTLIENGRAPAIFSSKIVSHNFMSSSHLVLNAFEYYMFSFSFYILLNPTPGNQVIDWISPEIDQAGTDNGLYFVLLKLYLERFVPLDLGVIQHPQTSMTKQSPTSDQNSIWHSLSSTTSSILSLATHSAGSGSESSASQLESQNFESQNFCQNSSENKMLPSLFKSSIFQLKTPFRQQQQVRQPQQQTSQSSPFKSYHQFSSNNLGSLEWLCNTAILMFSEIWLASAATTNSIPSILMNRNANSSLLLASNQVNVSGSAQTQAQTAATTAFVANANQMRALRMLIKHLHSFVNSQQNFNAVGVTASNMDRLMEIKQSIWSPKYPIQKSLYRYLRVAFTKWPIDTSFRLPLETWISYIQPWRYTSPFDTSGTLQIQHNVDWNWKNFISDNLLYYTVIFAQLLQRLSQMDLTTSRNAFMLFRVVKVYSQSGLLELLREAEENYFFYNKGVTSDCSQSSSLSLQNRSTAVLGGGSSTGTRYHHLADAEIDPELQYLSLFSPQVQQQIVELLKKVNQSIESCRLIVSDHQTASNSSPSGGKNWKQSLKSFLLISDDNDYESMDEKRIYKDKIDAEKYLKFSLEKLSNLFDIPAALLVVRPQTSTITQQTPTQAQQQSQLPSPLHIASLNQLSDSTNETPDRSMGRQNLSEFGSPIPIRHRPTSNLYSTPRPEANLNFTNLSMTTRLTPMSRHQLVHRQPDMAKSPQPHEGNPDLKPVRSYEIGLVVTLAIFLSTWINNHYADKIAEAYAAPGLKGWISRRFLSAPTCYIEFRKSSSSVAPVHVVQTLPPRVNLRPLASKHFLSLFAIILALVYFFI